MEIIGSTNMKRFCQAYKHAAHNCFSCPLLTNFSYVQNGRNDTTCNELVDELCSRQNEL